MFHTFVLRNPKKHYQTYRARFQNQPLSLEMAKKISAKTEEHIYISVFQSIASNTAKPYYTETMLHTANL